MCPETAPHHLSMLKMGTEEPSRQQLCQLLVLRELLQHALVVNTALSSALRCRIWVVLCAARIRLRGNLVGPFHDSPPQDIPMGFHEKQLHKHTWTKAQISPSLLSAHSFPLKPEI